MTSASNPVKGYSGIVAVDNAAAYQLVKLGGDSTGVFVGDSLRLRARVIDIYGNAVNGQTVFFTVQEGKRSPRGAAGRHRRERKGIALVQDRHGTRHEPVRASILDGDPEGLETQSFTVTTVPEHDRARHARLPGELLSGGRVVHGGRRGVRSVRQPDRYRFELAAAMRRASSDDEFRSGRDDAERGTLVVLRIRFRSADQPDPGAVARRRQPLGVERSPHDRPAPAYRIVEVRGDTLGVRVGAKVGLKARVSDAYGNAVPSEIVRFVITSNLGGSPILWDGTGAPKRRARPDRRDGRRGLQPHDRCARGDQFGFRLDSRRESSGARARRVFRRNGRGHDRAIRRSAGRIHEEGRRELRAPAHRLRSQRQRGDRGRHEPRGLGSNGSAVFSVNPATLTDGRATVTVYDNKAEKLVLRAQTLAGGALSSSDTITVTPGGSERRNHLRLDHSRLDNGERHEHFHDHDAADTRRVREHRRAGHPRAGDAEPRIRGERGQGSLDAAYRRAADRVERRRLGVHQIGERRPALSTVPFQSVTGSASGMANVPFMPAPSCAYAGYLTPRYLVPTQPASFRCSVANGSATGLYLTTQSRISFADSASNTYEAHLAAPVF